MPKLYKFLNKGMKSNSGNHTWEIGKWYKEEAIEICERGFHASKLALDALSYVQGEIVAVVEVRGESQKQTDKECWSEMRILKAYEWTKEDSVRLAIFSAEQVIHLYEKEYPNDDRPRKAIEAAREYVKNPTEENRLAAESARSAAWSAGSAGSAESAARSAAWSAGSAESAAGSAAWSARSAAGYAAESAAESAARSTGWSTAYDKAFADMKKKINAYMVSLIKEKDEIHA